jgi:hypothetical protein
LLTGSGVLTDSSTSSMEASHLPLLGIPEHPGVHPLGNCNAPFMPLLPDLIYVRLPSHALAVPLACLRKMLTVGRSLQDVELKARLQRAAPTGDLSNEFGHHHAGA